MAETDKLRDMLDNLINDKPEQAQVNFHSYLQDKMQEVVKGTTEKPAGSKETDKE